MATFRLRYFSSPDVLGSIDPRRLLTFLEPYREYFVRRLFTLPPPDQQPPVFDYWRLASCLMTPREDTPLALLDGLFFVDELATHEGMDALVGALREEQRTLELATDCTPADFALAVWLRYPQLLERTHAEQFLVRHRSFMYFPALDFDPATTHWPTADELRRAAEQLGLVFGQRHRGRDCCIFPVREAESAWFVIRHGEPYKREEAILDGAEGSSVAYRPLRYDIFVVDVQQREIRIHARHRWEYDAYLQELGRLVLGPNVVFPEIGKYTLEPLRLFGRASLTCSDVLGLRWVRLRELRWTWDDVQRTTDMIKSKDVFSALHAFERTIPQRPKLVRATFDLKLAGIARTRTVIIKPPNNAQYVRDDDCYIAEEWLARRGFIETPVYPYDSTDQLLVRA